MRTLRVVVGVIGGFFGFFLAAYPGVLLGATARPLFIGAHWLGALFLAIGASTGGAAIAFVLSLSGGQRGDALSRLMRFTAFALIVQLAALALFMLTVSTSGSAGIARSLSHLVAGPYGVPFWLGAVVIGIVVSVALPFAGVIRKTAPARSEEHTSELQPQSKLVCRLLLEKKKRAMGDDARRSLRAHQERHLELVLVRHRRDHEAGIDGGDGHAVRRQLDAHVLQSGLPGRL